MKHEGAEGAGVVSRETLQKLEAFASLLLTWNRTINLVGKATEKDLWQRHINDSLQLIPYLPAAPAGLEVAVDLGSGAGFPGLVLALATNRFFHLVEADQRKAAFLRQAAASLKAPVQVHAARIETLKLAQAYLVTARALAPLSLLMPMASRFLKPGGTMLLLKGAKWNEELTDIRTEWQMNVMRFQSVTDPLGAILRLTEVNPVSD